MKFNGKFIVSINHIYPIHLKRVILKNHYSITRYISFRIVPPNSKKWIFNYSSGYQKISICLQIPSRYYKFLVNIETLKKKIQLKVNNSFETQCQLRLV